MVLGPKRSSSNTEEEEEDCCVDGNLVKLINYTYTTGCNHRRYVGRVVGFVVHVISKECMLFLPELLV
jgi:hypothetical protein